MTSQAAAEASPSPLPLQRRGTPRLQELGLIIVTLILGTILTIYGHFDADGGTNTFFNMDNLVGQLATYMAVYAIMAVGQTCVIITGGIDISVGAIYALSALGAAAVLQVPIPEDQVYPPPVSAWKVIPLAMIVAPGIGLLCGLLNGGLVTGLRLHPFIVTLGTMGIFRGIANVTVKEQTLPVQGHAVPLEFTEKFMRKYFFESSEGVGGIQLMPTIVMLTVALMGWIYFRATIAGRETFAVGGNEEAARFSGIRVNRVKLRAYAISGLTAGVAGMLSLGRFSTASSDTGNGYELSVIAAAVVGGASLTGGRGTALGAILGALIINMIENGIFKMHLNTQYSKIIIGVAIILAVSIDRLSEYTRARRLARARVV